LVTVISRLLEVGSKSGYLHPSTWNFEEIGSAPVLPVEIDTVDSQRAPPAAKRSSKEEYYCFPVSLDLEIEFPKNSLESCFDVLFNDTETSLCSLVLDSIMKTDIDVRVSLLQNIILCGGGFATPGIQKRFYYELIYFLSQKPSYSSLGHLIYDVGFATV